MIHLKEKKFQVENENLDKLNCSDSQDSETVHSK